MSETKFTPGPWWVEHDREHYGFDTWSVASSTLSSIAPDILDKANAHLIAAAPDLYEALEDACDMLDRLGHLSAEYRAVLAKARGEE